MEKRIKMKCWKCAREYSLLRDLQVDEQPRIQVECPFCGEVGVVDLAPYRTERTEVLRSGSEANTGSLLDLPRVLPTSPLEE